MKTQAARKLAYQVVDQLQSQNSSEAYGYMQPILYKKNPFRLLDIIGEIIGQGASPNLSEFLNKIAADKTMGGWVVIASALRQSLNKSLKDSLAQSAFFIETADVWKVFK